MEGGDFCAQGDQAGDLRVFAKGGTSRFSKTWYGIPHLCKGGLLPPDFRRGVLQIFAKGVPPRGLRIFAKGMISGFLKGRSFRIFAKGTISRFF